MHMLPVSKAATGPKRRHLMQGLPTVIKRFMVEQRQRM